MRQAYELAVQTSRTEDEPGCWDLTFVIYWTPTTQKLQRYVTLEGPDVDVVLRNAHRHLATYIEAGWLLADPRLNWRAIPS